MGRHRESLDVAPIYKRYRTWYGCSSIPHRRSFPPAKHAHLLDLLAMPVTLYEGWQSGSNIQEIRYSERCTEM